MDDATLLRRFETPDLPKSLWNHRAHLRVAWNYLRSHPFAEVVERMRTGVKKINGFHSLVDGLEQGYHETMTEAWLRLLADAMHRFGAGESSEAFLDDQKYLGTKTLLRLFYSRQRIVTQEAKASFVDGDVRPLPKPVDVNVTGRLDNRR